MASVTVELKNPPAGAELWAVAGYSPDDSEMISSYLISQGSLATLNGIPDSWFPLKVHSTVNGPGNGIPPILWQKSSRPYHSGRSYYDPNFTIPSPGNYYLNVGTGAFESAVSLSGQIVKSEIIVGGQRLPMGSQVSAGDTLTASLTVQNLSGSAIEMGVFWQLLDPSNPVPYGAVRQNYNSPIVNVGAGISHAFDGPALTIDMEGTWAIYAELWGRVSGGAWEMLQSIYQPLCVVAGVPEAEFRGFSLSEYNRR